MKLDDIKKLQQKKYRNQFGHFLLEGEHLVLELQKAVHKNPLLLQSQLLVSDKYQDWQSPFNTQLLTERQMAQLADTQTPPGIMAVVPLLPNAGEAAPGERVVYLHEIQDPGNLGTILRSLAWFGGFRCLLSPGSVDPYNPKVVRASMGAIFHVPMELDISLAQLSERFTHIACLDMEGAPISSAGFAEHRCYVFGNEARGLPRAQLQALEVEAFTIPGSGAIESLNLATAVNLCVYELVR